MLRSQAADEVHRVEAKRTRPVLPRAPKRHRIHPILRIDGQPRQRHRGPQQGPTQAFEALAVVRPHPGPRVQARPAQALQRFDFNINYKGEADDLIKDKVAMKINLTIPTKGSEG